MVRDDEVDPAPDNADELATEATSACVCIVTAACVWHVSTDVFETGSAAVAVVCAVSILCKANHGYTKYKTPNRMSYTVPYP